MNTTATSGEPFDGLVNAEPPGLGRLVARAAQMWGLDSGERADLWYLARWLRENGVGSADHLAQLYTLGREELDEYNEIVELEEELENLRSDVVSLEEDNVELKAVAEALDKENDDLLEALSRAGE